MLSNTNNSNETHNLGTAEKEKIDHLVNLEIAKIISKMAFLGGTANITCSALFLWVIYNWANLPTLFTWFGIMLIANIVNILLNYYYQDKLSNLQSRANWRKLLLIIFALICLTWGSVSILFHPTDSNYELSVFAFLLVAVIGFSFPSICDFTLAIISICCLLMPSIVFYIYQGFTLLSTNSHNAYISFGISSSLFVLCLFLLAVTHIGSKLVRQVFQLSFTNVALSHKLEHINKFLEERVKERTIELEKLLLEVTHRATHDLLTNLPNQRSLVNYIKSAIKNAQKNSHMFGVIFFSINEIDRIYNALGYQSGDFIINSVAQRFREQYGEPVDTNIEQYNYIVTLARNDVFVILIQPILELDEIEEKLQPLFSVLEKAIYTEKQVLKLTASIGVSIYPRNGRNISSLLMNADAALLLAKQSGGNNYKMYKSEINAAITKQLELESQLHTALIKSEFILQYQPLVDLKTGLIVGAEALVRWENPTLGRISPDNFIPLAEANGIIIPLGEWVFRSACRQTQYWHQAGFTNLKIAVNISAKQLQHNITENIFNITKEINIDPSYIELELTETTAFRNEVVPILKQLNSMGFCLSIDDFGTGYSGLSNIKLFTIDKIKIDKSFVQDIPTSSDCRAIVANTIALARNLNVSVVAEGVETKEQLDFLIENECDIVQGFYFSHPVDADVFTEMLRKNSKLM